MNIGFLMGSFDPIHVGHLNMVSAALNSGLIDTVVIVPSGHNPWKKEEPVPFEYRLQMISESIKPFGEKCIVSDIEGKFDPPYYANKSLNFFRETYKNDNLFIICGSDTVLKIPHWKSFETDILPYYGIIEITRDKGAGNSGVVGANMEITLESGKVTNYSYTTVFTTELNISSTLIRSYVKNNLELYPLLPKEVIEIINKNNLYK